jgi:hypothetical protein
MFVRRPPEPRLGVTGPVDAGAMADLFAIVGLVTISLLGVARWWEEH